MKVSYLLLAEGFEEIEALATTDMLRRAGMEIKTVSISPKLEVKGAHDIIVRADMTFDTQTISDAQWIILPGGLPGAKHLEVCTTDRNAEKKGSFRRKYRCNLRGTGSRSREERNFER